MVKSADLNSERLIFQVELENVQEIFALQGSRKL